jgi:phosphate-selective porin
MRRIATILAVAAALTAARTAAGQEPSIAWGGYAQVRFTAGRDSLGFTIRRAKLWLDGSAPFEAALHFRVQALFRPTSGGALVLQDVWVGYGAGSSSIRVGQMVPDFSLERSQADATLPLIERAGPVNTLIPAATTGARDIGVQATLRPGRALWHLSVGLFNGNGGNAAGNEDRRFLVTGRAVWAGRLGGADTVALGGSAAYRRTGGLVFQQILGTTTPFAGEDFRWGAEGRLAGPRWQVQSEYLRARLGAAEAWGYYVLGSYRPVPSYALAASAERLVLPNASRPADPWYILGFTRYLRGDRAKLMLDVRVQAGAARPNYATAVQGQLAFH